MDAIELNRLINESTLELENESNTRIVGRQALELGVMCEQKGWYVRALLLWEKFLQQIRNYDSCWGFEEFPLPYPNASISNLMAEDEATTLSKRIDRLWKRVGHPELADAKKRVGIYYWDIWLHRYYDACDMRFIEEMEERLGVSSE